jgi:YebC/PmpR family DNA-binding regulatory protein
MSGHSKWKNIMHKKEKTDAARAKVFTKIGKEMAIAVREGGPDPVSNSKLRDLIAKAKANNVPNDNIDRIIKKASGADSVAYEKVTYEGYGIGGVAVIVEAMTDNRNRTGGDVRHYFDKFGGNLGQTGCVSYLFADKGTIIIENDGKADEDAVMEAALEAGAEDFDVTDEAFEITTAPDDLTAVTEALSAKGYSIISSEQEKIPSMYVTLSDEEQIRKMGLLLEKLDENDDVTDVWHNWENEE